MDFDGRIHHLEADYWLKFEIKRVNATPRRPHGLSCSFTLHGLDGKRLIGFDNAHTGSGKTSRFKKQPHAGDHWHRTERDPDRAWWRIRHHSYPPTNGEQLRQCLGRDQFFHNWIGDAKPRASYAVGYARPPTSSQYQPGQSGKAAGIDPVNVARKLWKETRETPNQPTVEGTALQAPQPAVRANEGEPQVATPVKV